MAASLGNAATPYVGSTAANSHTWSHTVEAGCDLLVVSLLWDTASDVLSAGSVEFGGEALTRLDIVGTTGVGGAVYYLVGPTAGAASVVVTLNAATTQRVVGLSRSVLNVNHTDPFGGTDLRSSNPSTVSSWSSTLTADASDSLRLQLVGATSDARDPWTLQSGWAEAAYTDAFGGACGTASNTATGTSVTWGIAGTGDGGTTRWFGIAFEVNAAAVLEPDDAAQEQVAETPTLAQIHTLAPSDAVQAQAADTPEATAGATLVVAEAVQAQTSDTPALTQLHEIALSEASQAQNVPSVGVTTSTATAPRLATGFAVRILPSALPAATVEPSATLAAHILPTAARALP